MRPVATYTVVSSIPEPLQRISEIAYNIRWAWDHETVELFRRMEPALWEETGHNPIKMIGLIGQDRMNALATDDGFLAQFSSVLRSHDEYLSKANKAWYPQQFGIDEHPQIAYFSFEFGLTESIPNYSGGLGVLAGDHLKASSDLSVPLVGIGLLYQQGYFRQYLNNDGWQQERYPVNDFYTMPLTLVKGDDGQPIFISVELPGRSVYAQIWHVIVGRVNLYLLDTNIPENTSKDDQSLTDQLYGGDRELRIQQEILLGIGGLRALQALGLEPAVCHMNEGHSAFMALERARILMDRFKMSFQQARAITSASNVFTTHTPVPAGNDYFKPELTEQYFQEYRKKLGLSKDEFLGLGRVDTTNAQEYFCMTILALRMSAYANGVSKLHGEVARDMWQDVYPNIPKHEVPIRAITNGVHIYSWVSAEIASLYDRYLGARWREDPRDPAIWQRAASIPDEELWRVHERHREQLVNFSRDRLVRQLENRGAPSQDVENAREVLDPDILTIGFARRFATYKRATLLLSDPDRFSAILCGDRPVQFVFAGKAHPHDNDGKEFIRDLVHFAQMANCRSRIVFLEDYDMVIARKMVQGVDVWLNTPRRPLEASGTSGMKATMNGVLNLSVLDGWWAEAYRRDIGWAIGSGEEYADEEMQDTVEANAIYELLEKDLIPAFYDRGTDGLPRAWIARMKASLTDLCPVFSMDRVVQDYSQSFYRPALELSHRLAANDYGEGRAFADWKLHVQENWSLLTVGEVHPEFSAGGEVHVGDALRFHAEVYLDHISPENVMVQLYEGTVDEEGEIADGAAHEMTLAGGSARGDGWFAYSVEIESRVTGQHGYSVRIIPRHDDLANPLTMALIAWA